MKNILITGGAGFIGTNLIKRLLPMGNKITVLDNLDPQVHGINAKVEPDIRPYISFIKGNVDNYHTCEQAVCGQDIIIHLAADTATGQSMYEITKCTKSNINGIANILQAITNQHIKVEKIIFTSSRAVYGEGKYICPNCGVIYPKRRNFEDIKRREYDPPCPVCHCKIKKAATDEDSLLIPQSIYGVTKLTQELYISTVCRSLNIPFVILRLQNVYGEGQSLINPYTGILSIFASRIITGKPIEIFEDGQESRDFIHVQDVIEVIVAVLMRNISNSTINVGSGKSTSVLELVKLLYSSFNIQPNYTINYMYRSGDIRHNYADIKLMHNLLGFTPSISLQNGIARFTNWVNEMDITENYYAEALNTMKGKGILKS